MLQFKEQVKDQYQILNLLGEAGGHACLIARVQGGMLTKWRLLVCLNTQFQKAAIYLYCDGEAGVADFEACIADFVVQVRSSISYQDRGLLTRALDSLILEMGGWEAIRITGLVTGRKREDCFRIIKEYLDYSQQ